MALVHIIGGGVSGLAAATLLAEAHVPVKLYEATAHAGGRARSSTDATLGTIDHGLHLIGGDSKELLAYMMRIGSQDSLRQVASPWHFMPAAAIDYAQAARALTARDGAMGDALAKENMLADGLLPSMARSLLHTKLELLSSKAARRAILHKLCAGKRGAKYFVAEHSLSESLITPALAHLDYHGGSVYFSHALKGLEFAGDAISSLTFARKKVPLMGDDVVILATPPSFAQAMLPNITVPTTNHASITVHYAVAHREATGIAAPLNAPVDLVRYDDGHIRLMLRVADHAWQSDVELLAHRWWRWVQATHPYLQMMPMPEFAVWREKRAGHQLVAHQKVDVSNLPPRLLLAGDWLDGAGAASLESAAASGHRAARAAMALMPKQPLRRQ